ncbi:MULTISPECIES: glycosyltransferase family 4 protein [unclassified Pseudomonas]|uniref:glycosyltransferase family 4 protein n=1 Tax=unclassified Pseudomonas TaxID=196821 RepID=UPI0021BB83B7|nr:MULTISPECIES: glycosyltransferase family 4 protein [unclassified Pseudomonas]MCT8166642.1 glycosyltransferase family 4 protein [Pseudomonas sp. HD6422]MCT8185538.1 glycosyltransferase family 4 protein [Pseudomonas sp. HD6421]
MRILLAHNFYNSATPSGENQVLEAERRLLAKNGDDVQLFSKYSDSIAKKGKLGVLSAALGTPWRMDIKHELRSVLDGFQPDIVHVHNTFPLISPAIFPALAGRAARVLTLHNYRLFCPAAIPMREGKVCIECMQAKSSLPSLIHGCYRESRLATLPMALNVELHRYLGTWRKHVDAFIALSEFQRSLMIDAGLPAEKVFVKPNFYPGSPVVQPWLNREPYVVFVGRLTAEKGVISLLRAWQAWGAAAPELRIVGDGALRDQLESMGAGLPVRFLGQVDAKEAERQIANARLQILPSEWFEGFPMVIREAFAFGTPAAVSDIGPLPSIVQNGTSGIVFKPAAPDSILACVRDAWHTPGLLERLGQGARLAFEENYTEGANYAILRSIYEQAMKVSSQ